MYLRMQDMHKVSMFYAQISTFSTKEVHFLWYFDEEGKSPGQYTISHDTETLIVHFEAFLLVVRLTQIL